MKKVHQNLQRLQDHLKEDQVEMQELHDDKMRAMCEDDNFNQVAKVENIHV